MPYYGNDCDANSNIILMPSKGYSTNHVINTSYGIQVLNGNSIGYAYKTSSLPNDAITLTRLESTYAKNASKEQIESKLTADLVKTVATQFREDSTFDVSLQTPTDEQNLKGIRLVTITITKGYDGKSNSATSIPIENVEIHGFKIFNTTWNSKWDHYLSNMNDVDEYKSKPVSEIKVSHLKEIVASNMSDFFTEYPDDVASKDITVEVLDRDVPGGRIKVGIMLYKWYSNGVPKNEAMRDQNYEAWIIGFNTTTTSINSRTSYSLDSMSNADNFKSIEVLNVSIDDLKQVIIDNKTLIYNDPVSNMSSDNIEISDINKNSYNGSIKFNITLKRVYEME